MALANIDIKPAHEVLMNLDDRLQCKSKRQSDFKRVTPDARRHASLSWKALHFACLALILADSSGMAIDSAMLMVRLR